MVSYSTKSTQFCRILFDNFLQTNHDVYKTIFLLLVYSNLLIFYFQTEKGPNLYCTVQRTVYKSIWIRKNHGSGFYHSGSSLVFDDQPEDERGEEEGEEDEDPDHMLSYLTTSQRMRVVRRKERRMRIQTTASHT